jgi:DNA-binding CsgD family transcriptional regulator
MVGASNEVEGRMIDQIYSVVFGEATWETFLESLNATLPNGKSGLLCHDTRASSGIMEMQSGFPDEWAIQYKNHFSKINPFVARAATRQVGVGVVDQQMLPRDYFLKTEYYNDGFRSIGQESFIGITIVRDEGKLFLLSATTSCSDANETIENANLLTRLAPHLRRAFKHFQNREEGNVVQGFADATLGMRGIGTIFVGDNGYIKTVSETAQALLDRYPFLAIGPIGKVRMYDQNANDALYRMLDRPLEGPRVYSFGTDRLKATLIRLNRDRESIYFVGPTVVITLESREDRGSLDESQIKRHFALTSAEYRALRGVYDGLSINEIADAAQVSRETIRSQLKSLFSKIGASSQKEILRIVGRWSG